MRRQTVGFVAELLESAAARRRALTRGPWREVAKGQSTPQIRTPRRRFLEGFGGTVIGSLAFKPPTHVDSRVIAV